MQHIEFALCLSFFVFDLVTALYLHPGVFHYHVGNPEYGKIGHWKPQRIDNITHENKVQLRAVLVRSNIVRY